MDVSIGTVNTLLTFYTKTPTLWKIFVNWGMSSSLKYRFFHLHESWNRVRVPEKLQPGTRFLKRVMLGITIYKAQCFKNTRSVTKNHYFGKFKGTIKISSREWSKRATRGPATFGGFAISQKYKVRQNEPLEKNWKFSPQKAPWKCLEPLENVSPCPAVAVDEPGLQYLFCREAAAQRRKIATFFPLEILTNEWRHWI